MFNKREAVEHTKAVISKQYGYDYQRGYNSNQLPTVSSLTKY